MVNRAHCLDLAWSWDEGAGLCLMQGVNEQHTWARLDLFLTACAELLSGIRLHSSSGHATLVCFLIKILSWCIKTLKTIGAKWYNKTPSFLCQNLEEDTFNLWRFKAASSCLSIHTWERFAVLASTPSLWLPNNCTWFFHPFWRFKGCSCCCCFPPPCYPVVVPCPK